MTDLMFETGGCAYGIPLAHVVEIRQWQKLFKPAGYPSHVLGILDLRGLSVPVVSLATLSESQAEPSAPTDLILVLHLGTKHMALAVQKVYDVVELEEASVSAPAEQTLCAPWCQGWGAYEGRLVARANAQALFDRVGVWVTAKS